MCEVSGHMTTERTFSRKRKSKWKRLEMFSCQVPFLVPHNFKTAQLSVPLCPFNNNLQ
jgi:hypothetical protein